jgi:hypothetical protein
MGCYGGGKPCSGELCSGAALPSEVVNKLDD